MTQTELDTYVVNLQVYLGEQGDELVNMLKYGDASRYGLAARHMALHAIMRALKDYLYSDAVLTDKQIFGMMNKADLLIQQDRHDDR